MSDGTHPPKPRGDLGRFALGLVAGLIASAALAVVALVPLYVAGRIQADGAAKSQALLNGREASRRGSTEVALKLDHAVLRAHCQGTCDDLRVDGNRVSSLRVTDARETCIACADYGWRGLFAVGDRVGSVLQIARRVP